MHLKRSTFLLLIIVLLVASCNKPNKTRYLDTSALEEQTFTINPTRDTTLLTKAGIIIDIPANAVTVPNGGNVSIQVKEALGLKDMLLSGLTTKSDSGLLASQGMFYIGSNTEGVEIKKQLTAKLPVDEIIPGTENYAGVYDEDSALQWVVKKKANKPEFDANDIAEGKALFKSNCAACHGVTEDGTGPPMAGMTSKYSIDWLIKFTRNFNDLVAECDCDAITAVNSRPVMMNLHYGLTDRDIKKIFAFVDGGELKKPVANCYDSCKNFMARVQVLENQYKVLEKQANTQQVHICYVDTSRRTPAIPAPQEFIPTVTPNYQVIPNRPQSYYYKIDIDAWGWYNADILLKDHYQLSPSNLVVSVPGYSKDNVNVSLVVPSVKCLAQGGLTKQSENDYAFMDDDGKIRLPIGQKAYVLVYGDVKGKFFFAAKEFTVATRQKFILEPKDANPNELKRYLALISENDIKAKTTEREEGKKMDALKAQLVKLLDEQPVNCNCVCYTQSPALPNGLSASEQHGQHGHDYNPCPSYPRISREDIQQ